MNLGRRGFLGALGVAAGTVAARVLTPTTADIIKFGPEAEKYGDDLIREMYEEGVITAETADSVLNTPLRKLTQAQRRQVERRYLRDGTREYARAGLRLLDSSEAERSQTLCLLISGEEVFEGPLASEWEETEDPWNLRFTFRHPCDREFTYDRVQIMTWEGDVFTPPPFHIPVNVLPGDTLNVNWNFSV